MRMDLLYLAWKLHAACGLLRDRPADVDIALDDNTNDPTIAREAATTPDINEALIEIFIQAGRREEERLQVLEAKLEGRGDYKKR
ncbi:hypothetical protein H257_03759 [Aphanomyces astaci]|uniref:Uncharacterized protein n=1 Tax=Aphanomyces astaci TaxID=112090 RepID=W4H0C0_APHAT|nr:hypothetical protein H257_03759 [Aphanomyces astaci]ETV84593.1 hypothetical protein H257_03759 [Aphanomyces astaci]|eukprot:XP_009826285.1 hypothetical protein H257_03759 [Aphanomyces astaci]